MTWKITPDVKTTFKIVWYRGLDKCNYDVGLTSDSYQGDTIYRDAFRHAYRVSSFEHLIA